MVIEEEFKQGEIVWVQCNPSIGHEQKGIRPALVLSNDLMNSCGMSLVAPISSKTKYFPTRIKLDGRTKTQGYIMLDQTLSMDLHARKAEKKEVCPADILQDAVLLLNEMTAISE